MRAPTDELRVRAARAILGAEHVRSLARRWVRRERRPFADPAAWVRRATRSLPRDFDGEALRWRNADGGFDISARGHHDGA